MSNWKTFKRILEKKKNEVFSKEKARKDIGLPLGLRIGAIVNIDDSTFIVNRDELGFELTDTRFVVHAYSEFTILGSFKYYRFYLGGENSEYILEFGGDENLVLYSLMDEIIPEDKQEWESWLDEDKGMIYDDIFTIKEDNLVCDFENLWKMPQFYVENIICDKYKENIETTQNLSNMFHRKIGENQSEFILISQEENSDEAYIKLMVGTNLLESDITVI